MNTNTEMCTKQNNYGMSKVQENFLKQVLIEVRNSRESGKKLDVEGIIVKELEKMEE